MGEPAEPFGKVGDPHFRSSEVGDFHFSACGIELGGFNFDMGHRIDARGATEALASGNMHGVESIFELSDAAKAFCTADYGAQLGEAGNGVYTTISEVGDDSISGWASPRISFSQDLPMEEDEVPRISRAFPEKRKRRGAEDGEPDDGYSSEFEFLSNGVFNEGGIVHQTKDIMLPADELFSDGKLLPIRTQGMASRNCDLRMQGNEVYAAKPAETRANYEAGMHSGKHESHADEPNAAYAQEIASPNGDLGMQGSKLSGFHAPQTAESRGNEPCMCSSKHDSCCAGLRDAADAQEKLPARHLSLELPRPNCGLGPLISVSVDNSPCSSPPHVTLAAPPNACIATISTSPTPQKAGSKYTFKIKDFFKPKRVNSAMSPQLTRDNSITSTSTCRIPIPPRSFWPFSRSNSAGESKTALPALPPRSNSAGESNTSRVEKNANEARLIKLNKNNCISHGQAAMVSASKDQTHITNTVENVNSAKDRIEFGASSNSTETSEQTKTEEECVPYASSQPAQSRSSQKGKASGSPGRVARRRYMYTTANFLRGSPGRRGGMNSLVKGNASRIVLKNLERCSADRKLCRETSGRRAGAYPVALRVSPVINVAVYRGKVPSSAGMFGLRSLFFSKKEKAKEKDGPLNNWRAGA